MVAGGATFGADPNSASKSTLTVGGTTTVASNGTLTFNLYDSNGTADLLVANGNVTLDGSNLNLAVQGGGVGLATNEVYYKLIDYSGDLGTGSLTNLNANVAFGSVNVTGISSDYVATVYYGDGLNGSPAGYVSVGFAMVPEPSTLVMLLTAGMMGGLGYYRRRRQQGRNQKKAEFVTQEG